MDALRDDVAAFVAGRHEEAALAGQRVALQLLCGIDLAAACAAPPDVRQRLARRLERAIERERLRGGRRDWSYDLDRHIALKAVLDRLLPAAGRPERTKGGRRPKTPPDHAVTGGRFRSGHAI